MLKVKKQIRGRLDVFFIHPFCVILPLLFLIISFSQEAEAQTIKNSDTTSVVVKKEHSPTKAAVFSAVLPGLGQVYNKKYWKIPIIYAGLGALLYIAHKQNQNFQMYKSSYENRLNGIHGKFSNQSKDWLNTNMLISRRNRDLMYILSGAVYLLNIVDATVDAYLFYFNVSDDLSMYVEPKMQPVAFSNRAVLGLSLTFNL